MLTYLLSWTTPLWKRRLLVSTVLPLLGYVTREGKLLPTSLSYEHVPERLCLQERWNELYSTQ